MSKRLWTSAGVVVGAAILVAGCGGGGGGSGSSGVSATSYAASICSSSKNLESAFSAQEQGIKTKLPSLLATASASPTSVLQQAKKLLQTFADNAETAAKSWQKDVHAAGTPNVTNGAALSSKLNAAVDNLVAAVGTLRSQIGSLPTSSSTAFAQAAQADLTKFQSAAGSSASAVRNLHSSALDAAAKKTPSCQGLLS
jgi:hypothetical protein